MSINKKTIHDYNIKGNRVLIRSDLNVPLTDDGQVAENFRIQKSLPTIEHVINNEGVAVVMSHLGRPDGQPDADLKMDPVAKELEKLLSHKVEKLDATTGEDIEDRIRDASPRSVFLLENLRFHPGEEENDDTFARQLAYLADIYVNDAFGSSHRNHASITGVPGYVQKSAAGLLMQSEIEQLTELLDAPESPFVLLLGGAKVNDKVGMVKTLLSSVDQILVGGALSFPFIKAQGLSHGDYELDNELISSAREILDAADDEGVDVTFPEDHLIKRSGEGGNGALRLSGKEIDQGWVGGDIGPQTIESFSDVLSESGSVFWNGPMGMFETKNFEFGTRLIASELAGLEDTVRVTGGGDTAAALSRYELIDELDHVSTGGGALIQFIQERSLPGIEALPG